MNFDRSGGQMKGGRDLGVRCPLAESDEDLLLAGGQLLEAASGVCVGGVLFNDVQNGIFGKKW